MKRILHATVLGVALVVLRQAEAALVYDNGPANTTGTAWEINGNLSDSFTLSSPTSLTLAQVALFAGDGVPTTVDWQIGTTPFSADVSSGTGSLTLISTFLFPSFPTSLAGYYTFAINASLGVGTYWLTLRNGLTSSGAHPGWIESDGPSSALHIAGGDINPVSSESFQLYAVVPEPTTMIAGALLLLPLGANALRQMVRKNRSV
jgi:hypothetical protein